MNNYSEYFVTRKPAQFAERILLWWHKRMLQIASKAIDNLSDKTILEVGAGHGFFAEACHKKNLTYHGLEMNEQQAQHLQNLGYHVTQGMIPPLPASNPVQVIWMSHVLEHANSYSEAKSMLQACYEKLDPNGHIVIIAPDIHHWKENFWSGDWSHGFPTSLNRVEQLLKEVGFSIHKKMHHTFTFTNPFTAWFLSYFFRLATPHHLLDVIATRLTKRTLAHSFMTVFGWRQIYLIGIKQAQPRNSSL